MSSRVSLTTGSGPLCKKSSVCMLRLQFTAAEAPRRTSMSDRWRTVCICTWLAPSSGACVRRIAVPRIECCSRANTGAHGTALLSHRQYTLIDKATAETLLTRIRAVPFRVRDHADDQIREMAFGDVPLWSPQVCLLCCVRVYVRAFVRVCTCVSTCVPKP